MKMRLIVQEIKNEPPRSPSTPRDKKLRDLAQLHKETVLGLFVAIERIAAVPTLNVLIG
jgi:hypothetical protein